jgi:hypothetical protein
MPRQSVAAIAAVRANPIGSLPRPRPDAPAEVRQIFSEILAAVPRDHFRPCDGYLIEQLAQAVLLARRAYAEIEANGPIIGGKRSPWVDVLEKAHRSSVALAGRLRLAPQMRMEARTAARHAKGVPSSIYDRLGWNEEGRRDD